MRHAFIAMMAFIAGIIIVSGAPSHAAPGPVPAATAWDAAGGMIRHVDYWGRFYRRNGYVPIPVPVPVPDAPPVVDVVPPPPPRPLSCGEYHYWDGEACVDARYNNPYLGPK